MTNDARILDALRHHDPAPMSTYDDVAAARAQARMEQIMATPPDRTPEPVTVPRRRATPRARALRWAAVPAVAAVGLGLSVVLPGGTPAAVAGWTAVADPLTGSGLDTATTSCEAHYQAVTNAAANGGGSFSLDGSDAPVEPLDVHAWAQFSGPFAVAGAEQRGDWSLVVFGGPDSEALICMTTASGELVAAGFEAPNTPDGRSSGWGSVGSGAGVAHVSGFASGGLHDVSDAPEGIGHEVGFSGTTDNGQGFIAVSGEVAPNVSAVTLHAGALPILGTGGFSVEATVANGRYLAWWPEPSDLYDDVRYTITFTDGTVLDNVRPTKR